MKRAALYCRVSTVDQHPETQLRELRQFAGQRGLQIVREYTDHGVSGTKARRPGLDSMMEDARRHRFDVLVVWSCDRLARSTKHLLQVLDEIGGMGIQFLSQKEAIDTEGPLGRAIIVIVSAMAELERCLIIERVRAGMRRARAEGRQIGRARLDIDRDQVVRDRLSGMSLTQVARRHSISRASVCRLMKEAGAGDALVGAGFDHVPAAKTLRECRCPVDIEAPPWSDETDCEEVLVAELDRRLPDADLKTCEDFRHLNVECCELCHECYPHYEMNLIDLADGGKAWVCDPVKWAIYPEQYEELQARNQDSPQGNPTNPCAPTPTPVRVRTKPPEDE